MEAFIKHTGKVVPLDRKNVDTDQIIPKQFLKRLERTGFGKFAFYDWRYLEDGTPNPDFILNAPRYLNASILMTGANFGCGSSREHAPWALQEYGFKVIIAPSFADIFRNNCFQNGILTVDFSQETVDTLISNAYNSIDYSLTIDLQTQTVTDGNHFTENFSIDSFKRNQLLKGLDDIGLTLQHLDAINAFELSHSIVTKS